MADTIKLGLPLVAAAQAQKHVTVNEAFLRLDALTQMTLSGVGETVPPAAPEEGALYAVGAGASGAWTGSGGLLALFQNGGWVFLVPETGWRAWDAGGRAVLTFDGVAWVAGLVAFGAHGGGVVQRTIELDHAVGGGATSVLSGALPAGERIVGVSLLVRVAVGGTGSFDLGVAGDGTRYGAGLSSAAGAGYQEITGSALAYAGDTDLVLTAGSGSFDGTGEVRIAVHTEALRAPRA